jgi:hypothetical protein
MESVAYLTPTTHVNIDFDGISVRGCDIGAYSSRVPTAELADAPSGLDGVPANDDRQAIRTIQVAGLTVGITLKMPNSKYGSASSKPGCDLLLFESFVPCASLSTSALVLLAT